MTSNETSARPAIVTDAKIAQGWRIDVWINGGRTTRLDSAGRLLAGAVLTDEQRSALAPIIAEATRQHDEAKARVGAAAAAAGASFRREVAARRNGRPTDALASLADLAEIAAPIAPTLAAATRDLVAETKAAETATANRLAAARAADPDLQARVAAKRAARLAR